MLGRAESSRYPERALCRSRPARRGDARTTEASISPFTLGYRPSFDGLRGVAILAVMIYHAGLLLGGWAGVDVFFALSGFLITSLLLGEHGRAGRIDLRHFYMRRLLRLLPALLLCVAVVGTLMLVTSRQTPSDLVLTLMAVVLYVPNWAMVFGLKLDLFNHTWSLGIEEQFYILWPPLLILLLRRIRCLTTIGIIAGSMAALSAAYRLSTAWTRPLDPFLARWLFAGLDSRADSLLVGCALAAFAASGLLRRLPGPVATALGALGAGVLILAFAVGRFTTTFYVYGVSTVVAVATTFVIVDALRPSSWLARCLSVGPLVAIGKISYGLYVWHFSVFWTVGILNPYPDRFVVPPLPSLLVSWVATFAIAGASYWLVERRALQLKARFQPRPPEPGPAPSFEVAHRQV